MTHTDPTPDQLKHMRSLAFSRASAFNCLNYTDDLIQEGWIAYYSREGTEDQRFMNAWDAMMKAVWKWKYGIHYHPSRTNHPNVTVTQVVSEFAPPEETTPEDIYARKEIIEKTHQALQQDRRKMSNYALQVWESVAQEETPTGYCRLPLHHNTIYLAKKYLRETGTKIAS